MHTEVPAMSKKMRRVGRLKLPPRSQIYRLAMAWVQLWRKGLLGT